MGEPYDKREIIPDDCAGIPADQVHVPACYAGELSHVLITRDSIQQRIDGLAKEVGEWVKGEPLCLLCVLKGAFATFSLLLDALRKVDGVGPIFTRFIRLSSYSGTQSTGEVQVLDGGVGNVGGLNVLVVEDIVDTGHTAAALRGLFQQKAPRSFKLLSLLQKRTSKSDGYKPDFCGFEIPDRFVIGFGLDYNQYYRDLPYVAVISQAGIDRRQ